MKAMLLTLVLSLLTAAPQAQAWFGKKNSSFPALNSASVGKEVVIEYSTLFCTNNWIKTNAIVPGTFFMVLGTKAQDCHLPKIMQKYKNLRLKITTVSAPSSEVIYKFERCRRGVCDLHRVEFQTVFVKSQGGLEFPVRYILGISIVKDGPHSSYRPIYFPSEWFN